MNMRKRKKLLVGLSGWAVWAAIGSLAAWSQGLNPFTAPPSLMDSVSSGPVGSAAGNVALSRAQNLAPAPAQTAGMDAFGIDLGQLSMAGFDGGGFGGGGGVGQAVQEVIKPRVKVLAGARVFDALTGELLDDARLIWVSEEDKQNYFDDGTRGDPVAEDGEYADVEEIRGVFIGQSNQRYKEHLIQALYEAEQLDLLDFYGFSLMSTDRARSVKRNRRWKVVPDPGGGIGFTLAEVPADQPMDVPKYRDWEAQRDEKIAGKDGWAIRFLDEYRRIKGDVTSDFYPLYIPMPPAPPRVPPPTRAGWRPFPNPQGPTDPTATQSQQAGAAGGGFEIGGLGGFSGGF